MGVDVVKFGSFEVHLTTAELYRHGRLVRLQRQPFEVLRALVEEPGALVTREALRKRLWPDGVTVDFDQSLNKCLTKLRDALGDTATNPRFIETLPKRGYRLIVPVTGTGLTAAVQSRELSPSLAPPPATTPVAAEPVVAATSVTTLPQARSNGTRETDTSQAPTREPLRRLWVPLGLLTVAAAASGLFAVLPGPATGVEAHTERAPVLDKPATASPIFAARDAYERGGLALARRTQSSLKLSVEHFERAVALSPRYAQAYVGLADSWSLLASYGLVDPREGMPRARDAANRALTLDPTLARAHTSLGRTTMIFDWDWTTAEWHFSRALAIEPGSAKTHQWHAYLLSARGRHDDAIEEARRAILADPLSLNTNTALGFVLYLARRFDDASVQLERTLEIDPDFPQARRNLALVRVQQGRVADAVAGLQRVAALEDGAPVALAELAWAHAVAGDRATARRLLSDLDRRRSESFVPPDALALVYAGLGDRDEAVAWLQRAATMRVAALAHFLVDPFWDVLREDTRVQALAQSIAHPR
jgi:DNA-binding winged helix-turn-helix (wHTH) protein/tetratricopeptide (TPR) repeat protein